MALALALVVLHVVASSADERRPTALAFEAPPSCPPRERFEQELVFRTSRVRLAPEPDATARIEVRITESGRRFSGHLVVRTADGKNITKDLRGPKCESVTAALSLAVALVLDPEGTNTAPLPAALPPVPVELPPPPKEPEPVSVAPPPPARPPVEPPPPSVAEPPPPPSPSRTLAGAVYALGLLTTTVSGAVDVGGGAGGELVLAPAEGALRSVTRLGVGVTSGRTVTSLSGAARYAVGVNGLLSTAAALQLGAVRPELGVTLQLTAVQVGGVGADQNLSSQRWLLAAGPHARVTAELARWLVGVEGMLAISAIREQYRIDPDGLVFGVPPLGVVVQLQAGRAF